MPPKRKAQSQIPQDQSTSRPLAKKQQKLPNISTQSQQPVQIISTSTHSDFGSAFASLFETPTPQQVNSTVTTTAKAIPSKPETSDKQTKQKHDKSKKSTKMTKSVEERPQKLTMKEKKAAKLQLSTTAASFTEAKDKLLKKQLQTSNVVTSSRLSEQDRLAEKLALVAKNKQKEKKMLMDKDHVRPQYNETEKQLVRIATKGVVTLFQAVWEQTQKIKELQHASHLSASTKDRLISEESQAGFLDLLKQASEANTQAEPVFVPSNRRKFTDLKSKLQNDEDIDLHDLRGIGLSDGDDSDDDGYDREEEIPKFKKRLMKQTVDQNDTTQTTKSMQKNNRNSSSSNPSKPLPTWSVLDDDYLQSKNTGKMKDWEHDDTSDSSDL